MLRTRYIFTAPGCALWSSERFQLYSQIISLSEVSLLSSFLLNVEQILSLCSLYVLLVFWSATCTARALTRRTMSCPPWLLALTISPIACAYICTHPNTPMLCQPMARGRCNLTTNLICTQIIVHNENICYILLSLFVKQRECNVLFRSS